MLVALIAASAGVWFARWQSPATPADPLETIQQQLTHSLIFPEDFRKIPEFSLLDKNNSTITEKAFEDRWSMIFFGFTQCPDICPITLSVVRDSIKKLTAEHPDVTPFQVVFVSVDPKRDTPEVIKPYIESFGDDYLALTGSLENVLGLTQSLNIVVSFEADEDDPTRYTVDHTASMLLVDPQRRIRAKFNPPHEPDTLVADYKVVYTALNQGS